MKLETEFIRHLLLFDVKRLKQEIGQFAARLGSTAHRAYLRTHYHD